MPSREHLQEHRHRDEDEFLMVRARIEHLDHHVMVAQAVSILIWLLIRLRTFGFYSAGNKNPFGYDE